MSQYPLKMPDDLMHRAREAALEENVSLDQMLLSLIANGMGHRISLKALRDRARRGNPEKALEILQSLEKLPPEPGDEMPKTDRANRPVS